MKRYGFEQHTQVYNVSYSVKMNTKKVPKGRGGGRCRSNGAQRDAGKHHEKGDHYEAKRDMIRS